MTIEDKMITRTLSPKARKEIIREIDRRVRKNYVNLGGVDLDEWVRELEKGRGWSVHQFCRGL